MVTDAISVDPVNLSVNTAVLNDRSFFNPLLSRCPLHPLSGHLDPTLTADINGQPVHLLIDSGAHVSVLPKVILGQLVDVPPQMHPRRPVKAFGGKQIQLDGPVHLNITICGVRLRHPFYYLDAPVPAVAGYDIMRAAKLVLDTHSRVVWSHYPNVFETEGCSDISNPGEPINYPTVTPLMG